MPLFLHECFVEEIVADLLLTRLLWKTTRSYIMSHMHDIKSHDQLDNTNTLVLIVRWLLLTIYIGPKEVERKEERLCPRPCPPPWPQVSERLRVVVTNLIFLVCISTVLSRKCGMLLGSTLPALPAMHRIRRRQASIWVGWIDWVGLGWLPWTVGYVVCVRNERRHSSAFSDLLLLSGWCMPVFLF